MKKFLIFLFTLITFLIIISAYLHLVHSTIASYFITATLLLFITFDILCLAWIYRSKSMNKSEKWMYGIAVVLVGWIGGLLYLVRRKNNILN
ncbi:MAG: PLDc N-terminal domain-containing protein [Chitinophagaceae bacterium]|nr:PLDc N-terminal domain-containing protein [Chitinophagaceae bacterium]